MTGVLLLTPSATQGGPRPFADLACHPVPRLRAPGIGVQAFGLLRLRPHPPRCARHLLLKEKALGTAGSFAFPLRGRWHSEAVTDEVLWPQGPAQPGAPVGCRHQRISTHKAGGRRGNRRSREFRTPEREGHSATERGVSRGSSPWTRSLGTFSGARESTSPAGARTGKD